MAGGGQRGKGRKGGAEGPNLLELRQQLELAAARYALASREDEVRARVQLSHGTHDVHANGGSADDDAILLTSAAITVSKTGSTIRGHRQQAEQ